MPTSENQSRHLRHGRPAHRLRTLMGPGAVPKFSPECGIEFGEKEFREAQGMRIDLYVAYWYEKRPWNGRIPSQK